MSTTDRILDVIDAGLQSSDECGYGTDRDPSMCARCLRHEPDGDGDLCGGCRAFLLGDSDVDPAQKPPPNPEWVDVFGRTISATVTMTVNSESAARAFFDATYMAADPGPTAVLVVYSRDSEREMFASCPTCSEQVHDIAAQPLQDDDLLLLPFDSHAPFRWDPRRYHLRPCGHETARLDSRRLSANEALLLRDDGGVDRVVTVSGTPNELLHVPTPLPLTPMWQSEADSSWDIPPAVEYRRCGPFTYRPVVTGRTPASVAQSTPDVPEFPRYHLNRWTS